MKAKHSTDKSSNNSDDIYNHLKSVSIHVGGYMLLGAAAFSMASVLIPHHDTKMVLRIASAIIGVVGGGIFLVGILAPKNQKST